jgi:cytoskeletal protein CcmA (bactofilin family)
MGATYTRQSSSGVTDGAVIEASDLNNEFDQLLAAFAVSSGHTHDGTAAEGGPVTKLLGTAITIGDGTAGTDIAVTFDGETGDGVLTWMEDEDYFKFSDEVLMNSTEKLLFGDTGTYIHQSADGVLDLVSDTEIEINATTIDINGAVAMDGAITGATNITLSGELDAATLDISGNADIDGTLEADAITINGTAIGSIYGVVAGSSSIVTTGALNSGSITSGFGTIDTGASTITTTGLISGGSLDIDNVLINGTTIGHTDDTDLITLADGVATVAGELDATTLDISGNADIDGTTNLDAVDIDGAVQLDATLTVGVDDQGYDVKLFGDTASAYMLWDTSADDLILGGGAGLIVPVGQFTLGSVALTSTATELNLLDALDRGSILYGNSSGVTAVLGQGSADTVLTSDGTDISWAAAASSAADDISVGDAAINLTTSSGSITIDAAANDTDIIFKGTDATADITMLTLDGSEAGAAIFNSTVTATGFTIGSAAIVEAELELLDGLTAGTAIASKVVTTDASIDTTGQRNLTISGELDAATLDVSGDADIDGTLEADAITVDGVTLAEFISDTTGAMFSSNTETGITATYQDADNTIDLALAAAQTTITSIYATDLILGEDAQTAIDFGTANEIDFKADNAARLTLSSSVLYPVTDNQIDLGTASLEFKNVYVDGTVFTDALGFGTVVMTLPTADGNADQILTTDGSGALSFVDNSGGTDWQAVKTGNFTASGGQGVFANTTSSAFTVTLPAGTIGDEVSIIDYAGTADSNNITIAANGSEKIHGSTDDLTVATERAAFTLVFTDSTQGWLLKDK